MHPVKLPTLSSRFVLIVCSAALAHPSPAEESDLTLWYRQPAGRWIDALALGNGRLGAMVFGGTSAERIGLNEDTLWSGG
ncbi:MAG: glycoside hydrolase N-terminal domain-containing protein, partial [Phycisphaerae bacterium]|nr:glycoside hydrolase N-terminal domain-containing protein [Saprospiraceae bacterium]